jgi:hypothetical protein
MANILVHFKNVEEGVVMQEGNTWKQYKRDAQLVGNIQVVIADLGFAKQLVDDDMT